MSPQRPCQSGSTASDRDQPANQSAHTHISEQRSGGHAFRSHTGKPFTRRELVSAGGGALVVGGGALAGVPLLLDSETSSTPAPGLTTAPTSPADVASSPVPSPAVQRTGEDALVETSVADLQGFIHRREVSVEALVDAAERRINRYDATYGAVIELNPDARAIAQELDAELARGESRGPLHGMPVLLKDVVATGDAMRTTTGALALAENDVAADAKISQRLRDAGAVILGKANLTEWSNVRGSGQSHGWSDRGGQTGNPYDPAMSPWGSSSGSAAAVALSYVPLAIGCETNGSIIAPASACGVVGLKPTVGLVSRSGVMPVSTTLDSPGPMARSVADAAAMMNVIAGFDPDDPAYGPMGWVSPASTVGGSPVHQYDEVDYLASLDPDGLKGARIGVCWQLWGFDPEADAVAEEVLYQMEEAGAVLVQDVSIPSLLDLQGASQIFTMVNTEFSAGMADFFERYMPDGPVASMQEVVDWNLAHAEEVRLDITGQDGLVEAIDTMSLDNPAYQEAVSWVTTMARAEGMDAAMDTNELDAIVAPSAGVPTEILVGGTTFPGSSTQAAALAGYPSISVPIGYVRGLPVGMHLSGRAFSEQTLIRIAYGLERLLQARTVPDLQVSTGG